MSIYSGNAKSDQMDAIHKWVNERFAEEYPQMDSAQKEKAFLRLMKELEIINSCGFAKTLYHAKQAVDHAYEENRLVVDQGDMGYSYVGYYLGLTEVNPVLREYPLEIAFGVGEYDAWRSPAVFLRTAEDYREHLFEFLSPSMGEEAEHMVWDTPLVSKTEKILAANVESDSTEHFHKERKKIFGYNYPSGKMPGGKEMIDAVRAVVKGHFGENEEIDAAIREDMDEFAGTMIDGTYEGLLRAVELMRGAGIWENMTEPIKTFFTRDDVLSFALDAGYPMSKAFKVMVEARKGKYASGDKEPPSIDGGEEAVRILRNGLHGVDYLSSEARCISDAQMILYLAEQKLKG